jgi:hypothetical protein
MKYSIGVGTFNKRFEKYFKPLINQIKTYRPELEIIVHINAPLREQFDENYRKEILNFCSEQANIFPIITPVQRGFSKIVNTCLIYSSNNNILMLNDDLTIISKKFFDELEKILKFSSSSFKINGSWSHIFLNRQEVNDVGWMDERYLGFGEEDGDFEWRYQEKLNKPFVSYNLPDIENHVEQNDFSENMEVIYKKYSAFNTKFAFQHKYKEDEAGKKYGIMNKKLICINETKNQYPNEKFFWLNKDKV